VRLKGGGLAGYSGGTAQVFDLLPFYPPEAGGTLTWFGQCPLRRVALSTARPTKAELHILPAVGGG